MATSHQVYPVLSSNDDYTYCECANRDIAGNIINEYYFKIPKASYLNTSSAYYFTIVTDNVTVCGGTPYNTIYKFPVSFASTTHTVTSGTGTAGYLTKWSDANTVTSGPALGSSTTTFLRNDGTWATPTASIPSAVASVVDSDSGYIDVQRYASSSHRLFLQHGTFSTTTSYSTSSVYISVTFPTSFPSADYHIVFTFNSPSTSYGITNMHSLSKTVSSCLLFVSLTSSASGTWQGEYIAVLTV